MPRRCLVVQWVKDPAWPQRWRKLQRVQYLAQGHPYAAGHTPFTLYQKIRQFKKWRRPHSAFLLKVMQNPNATEGGSAWWCISHSTNRRGVFTPAPFHSIKKPSIIFDKCGHAHNYTFTSASKASTFVCYRGIICSLRKRTIKMIRE